MKSDKQPIGQNKVIKEVQKLQCPFNPNHRVENIQAHVQNCKYKYKHNFVKCRYNVHHIVHKDQIEEHRKKCAELQTHKASESDDSDWTEVEPQPPRSPEPLNSDQASRFLGKKSEKKKQGNSNVIIQDWEDYDYSG